MKKIPTKKQPKTSPENGPRTISGAMLVSHQLMSTLTAMKWSLKMLDQGDFGPVSSGQKNILEKIGQRNDMLISLANRVLHASKLEDETYCCNMGLVDMTAMVTSTMEYCKEIAAQKNISMEFEVPPHKILLPKADEEMLKVAVQNIFDNAIKYTRDGGNVKISLHSDEKNATLCIQDSGIGVPENQKRDLFQKFFRAENAVKLHPAGSGLGLFICKSIIEAHGGKIWFDSTENQGSSFYISLPVE